MRRCLGLILLAAMMLALIVGCGEADIILRDPIDTTARNNTTMLLAGTDDLGRTLGLPGDEDVPELDETRQVGVFYFTWVGVTGTEGPYDISKILENDPYAARDGVSWLLAGGGEAGTRHWWGESIFGYYRTPDLYVMDKDVQMLTDAGVDFLMIDASNGSYYETQVEALLMILNKYYQQGYDVPQITFVTKASPGKTAVGIYEDIYKAHPEYDHLWYRVDGKPLLITSTTDANLSLACREYFTIKWPQWPKEAYHADSVPWIDLDLDNDGKQTIYEWSNGSAIMSVSVAQHAGTLAFSSSALYMDDTNHTRSWHDGANDKGEDAWKYGYNFAEQFENAIAANVDYVILTGWNEWIASRQNSWKNMEGEYITDPIIFVDTCDINNSRDLMPMNGGYGDNYYMLMIDYIRKFKGVETINKNLNTAAEQKKMTIDVSGLFSQWNDIDTFYLDYQGDTLHRDAKGWGKLHYTDFTGRNDIEMMKVTNDGEKLYFYVQTAENILGMKKDHCMTLFLSVGTGKYNWEGYDFVVNRIAAGSTELTVEMRTENGWEICGKVAYKQAGRAMQLEIPLEMLGILDPDAIELEFKWADNYQGEDDIWSFYKNGDAAPYGRLNFVYGSLKDCAFVRESREEAEKKPHPDGLKIKGVTVEGVWSEDRINGETEDSSYGPSRVFDKDTDSRWNPCATDFKSGEALILELNGTYTLESMHMDNTKITTYFEVYTSADGEQYQKVAAVDSSNAGECYADFICDLSLGNAENVKFVKLVFTGAKNSTNTTTLWLNIHEITFKDVPPVTE